MLPNGTVVDLIQTGKVKSSMKTYNGRVSVGSDEGLEIIDKRAPQNLILIRSAKQSKGSLGSLVEPFGLLKRL